MSLLSTGDGIVSSAERAVASIATRVPPTVFLVHEDVSVLQSLEAQIRVPGWRVETFESALGFLSRPPVHGPSCLVVDVALPALKSLQKRVAADWTSTPIILVREGGDVVMTVQAATAGSPSLGMTSFGDELSSAIAQAIEHSETALRREQKIRALQDRYESLSAREREVMALVATGLLNKRVAHELGISEITVKAHRGRVTRKMEARSFADLVKMAASLQLISWQ